MKLIDHSLHLRNKEYAPIVVGGMGVDISTADLALEACRLGAIGHISDAMVQWVSDRNYGTHYSCEKKDHFKASLKTTDKSAVKFNLKHIEESQHLHVSRTMSRKKGSGLILINIMEKLSMGAATDTLKARLWAALDAGIDGITLSAGLNTGSLALIKDHPRFSDALIGIIVSSDRALRIFLKSAQRVGRLPDYIIVEGPLAGGHLGFGHDWQQHNLHTIVADVLRLLQDAGLKIPVIPAGGIFTGTDATEFIEEGAAAVQVATRLTVTKESGLPAKVKQEYFKAAHDDVVVNEASPTGYLMRMLKNSPCLNSNVRPTCEAFGYMLSKEGKCAYISAYEQTPVDERGRKLPVQGKMCLCYHFSKCKCYTCGENVYRLKDTTHKNADGTYQLLTTEHVLTDYLYSEHHSILLPAREARQVPAATTSHHAL